MPGKAHYTIKACLVLEMEPCSSQEEIFTTKLMKSIALI